MFMPMAFGAIYGTNSANSKLMEQTLGREGLLTFFIAAEKAMWFFNLNMSEEVLTNPIGALLI